MAPGIDGFRVSSRDVTYTILEGEFSAVGRVFGEAERAAPEGSLRLLSMTQIRPEDKVFHGWGECSNEQALARNPEAVMMKIALMERYVVNFVPGAPVFRDLLHSIFAEGPDESRRDCALSNHHPTCAGAAFPGARVVSEHHPPS